MYKALQLLSVADLILLASCDQKKAKDDDGIAVLSADSMKQHIAILASDSFMGRKPFTEVCTERSRSITIGAASEKLFAAVGVA